MHDFGVRRSLGGVNEMIDAVGESIRLLKRMDMGYMRGVAYDTAWVARIKNANGKPMFPQSLRWVLNHQRPDGSWGCEIGYKHDRIISTLASVLALEQYNLKKNFRNAS